MTTMGIYYLLFIIYYFLRIAYNYHVLTCITIKHITRDAIGGQICNKCSIEFRNYSPQFAYICASLSADRIGFAQPNSVVVCKYFARFYRGVSVVDDPCNAGTKCSTSATPHQVPPSLDNIPCSVPGVAILTINTPGTLH